MIKVKAPLEVTSYVENPVEKRTPPFGIVIFGASGDLTHRKLIPALYDLYYAGLLPEDYYIVGSARTHWTDKAFRQRVLGILKDKKKPDPKLQKKFAEHIYYRQAEYTDPGALKSLDALLKELSVRHGADGNIIFYFATPSSVYAELIPKMAALGMVKKTKPGEPWIHTVFEKPFGHDLESARNLDRIILSFLDETQVYRIDHYLGKETVQNVLAFRFANTIFEPLWNYKYIDHVQITASETLGVEHRAGYYEKSGVLRDMFQNHMFQLLTLVAMEAPSKFEADQYHNEKLKVARAIVPIPTDKIRDYVVLGQYGAGKIDGHKVPAYRKEKGVSPHSKTDTFAAVKVLIDNPRWKGVPFYLRSGKRLNHALTEIAVHFKKIPHPLFPSDRSQPNVLSFRIQPNEGIFLSFEAKCPGPKMNMASFHLDFSYKDVFKMTQMGPYERLLLDCIQGEQMLFVRKDMVEASWKFIDSILEHKDKIMPRNLPNYPSGSWGPEEANHIIHQDGRRWQDF